jgi:hypothetical protein
VIVGTLLGPQAVVDAGGVLLIGVLVLLAWGVRGAGQRRRWSLCAFRLLVFILLVSIPIGLLLAGRGPA